MEEDLSHLHGGNSSCECHESSPQPLGTAKSISMSSCFPTGVQQNIVGSCYSGKYFLVGWEWHSPATTLCKGRDLTKLLSSKPKMGWVEGFASPGDKQRLSHGKENRQRVEGVRQLEKSGKYKQK